MIMRQKEFMSVPKQYKVYRLKKKRLLFQNSVCAGTQRVTQAVAAAAL